MTTGEHIRALRKEHGMLQWELADKVGCSKQVISNIERGLTGVSADMAARCAAVFHVTVDKLTVDDQPRVVRLSPDEMGMLQIYRSLDERGREFIRTMVISYQNCR